MQGQTGGEERRKRKLNKMIKRRECQPAKVGTKGIRSLRCSSASSLGMEAPTWYLPPTPG